MSKNLKAVLCFVLILMMVMASTSALAASKAYIFKVNGNNVRMRESGELGSGEVGQFNKGAKMLYLGHNNGGRLKVAAANGKEGWIYKAYLSAYGVVAKSKVFKTIAAAPIYKYNAKSDSFRNTGNKLAGGRYVCRVGKYKSFSLVRNLNGKSYIVPTNYLKKASF